MSSPSSAVEVGQTSSKGRSLISTRSIAPGTTILTATPLLLLPSLSHLPSICTYCLKANSPRACTRCRSAYYCGAACQRAHWTYVHSAECKPLKRIRESGNGDVPTPVRLVMQILLKQSLRDGLSSLEGNVLAMKRQDDGQRWADIQMMALGAVVCAGLERTEQEVVTASELMCKVQTNAFNWSDDEQDQAGVFIEPTLAMMNHSCIPNAEVQVMGRNIILRATTTIDKGDAIEISYTDYTWPKPRRDEALKPYGFQCQCPRCKDGLNIYEACARHPGLDLNRVSIAPEVCDVKQHPLVTDRQRAAAAKTLADEAFTTIYPSQSTASRAGQLSTLRDRYKACRGLMQGDTWAMSPVPSVLADISNYYAQQGRWGLSLATACLMATSCDPYRYPAPFHSARVQGLFRIAKLLSNTAADTNAESRASDDATSKSAVDNKVILALKDIDQVSLCQMLLMMVLRLAPEESVQEWDIALESREMLQDILQLVGRTKEQSLIDTWAKDAAEDQSMAFFKFGVVDPIHLLAGLGIEALDADFKS